MAAALHLVFCEWRTLRVPAGDVEEAGARALVVWRRVEHAEGNAAAWDARRDALRAYHADWLRCWQAEPGGEACADAAAPDENATVRAVRTRECAEARGLDAAERRSFAECLAAAGHTEPRPPRWTRDDFGERFDGPSVSLTALFAEGFGLPAASARTLGWWRGVLAPAALAAGALWLLSRGRRPLRGGGRGAR